MSKLKPSLYFFFNLLGLLIVAWLSHSSTPSMSEYLDFADKSQFYQIPHFFDVTSNLAFLIPGIYGLLVGFKNSDARYKTLALGFVLVCFGSSYFHWEPTSERLFWDRLPMTIVFTTLTSLIISDRVHSRIGLYLWPFFLILGVYSIYLFHFLNGSIALYAMIQFGSLWITLLSTLFFPKNGKLPNHLLILSGAFYILAKITETFDKQIANSLSISGHTIKHLLAGVTGLLLMMAARKFYSPIENATKSM